MKKTFYPLLLVFITLYSCKKDKTPPPVDLSGTTFKGTAKIQTSNYDPFTIVFNADGSATFGFNTYSYSGSWNKTPNSSIVYIFFDETTTYKWKGQATLNASNNKLENGTFTRIAPSAITGTFAAEKQ